MTFTPAQHQTWWTEHWTDRHTDLAHWLETSDAASRQAVFAHADQAHYGSVLEIGPGLMIDYRLHWERRPQVAYQVVDVTQQVVELARSNRVPAQLAAIEQLPFADRAIEFVYCRHVWEHCPHYEPALREMLRVASKGAAVVLFRHKFDGADEINYGTYDGLENVYHNTYSRVNITDAAERLGWMTHWTLTSENAVAFFTPLA